MNEKNVKCKSCGWTGERGQLVCTDEDARNRKKKTAEINFNLCPECKKVVPVGIR